MVLKHRHGLRLEFWELALEAFRKSSCTLYNNISPSRDHWLSAGSGLRSCPYNLIFGQNFIRVEFSMQRPSQEENKNIFDQLLLQKSLIESEFGEQLQWLRLDEKIASRVQYVHTIDGYDKLNWQFIIDWMIKYMQLLEQALEAQLQKIKVIRV